MANPIRRGADPPQLRAGSRLSREAHDRLDGSGEGKFLPATLLSTATKHAGHRVLEPVSSLANSASIFLQP